MTPVYFGGNSENDRLASPESVPILTLMFKLKFSTELLSRISLLFDIYQYSFNFQGKGRGWNYTFTGRVFFCLKVTYRFVVCCLKLLFK